MNKRELVKVKQKWEKILKKEGLNTIEQGRYVREDRITQVINSDKEGLEVLMNKFDFWDAMQYFYWEYYPNKCKSLELYILGHTNSEICKRSHLKYNKVSYLIKKFRSKFKTYLTNRSPKISRN